MPKRRHDRPGQIGEYWLSQRPNSDAWCRTWYEHDADGDRQTRRASLRTSDPEEAKLRLAQWVLENRRLRDERPDDVPLETVLVRYYQQHASRLPSAEQARIALALWSDHLPHLTVAELTPDRQEAFVADLRGRGLSDGYISRVLSVGRAALNRAYRRGELRTVPFVMDVEKGAPRDRRLSLDEAAALFEAADAPHLLMYLMVAFNTLARPEAILDLQPFQVDLENRVLHLNPRGRRQTAKRRPAVPITDTLRPWLAAVRTPYVVCYAGRRLGSIKTAFRTARERAGLGEDVTPYTIRHTMATELRRRGVPPWEVAGMLGHRAAGYGVTEVYAVYDPDFLGRAAGAIDAYFADLQPACRRPLVLPSPAVRSSCVLGSGPLAVEALEKVVGAAGIEPATPTMST